MEGGAILTSGSHREQRRADTDCISDRYDKNLSPEVTPSPPSFPLLPAHPPLNDLPTCLSAVAALPEGSGLTVSSLQPSTMHDTTLLTNEEEAFALEPLDTTSMVSGKYYNQFSGCNTESRLCVMV